MQAGYWHADFGRPRETESLSMQRRCSDLGIVYVNDQQTATCSLFASCVQPVPSYACETWGLERLVTANVCPWVVMYTYS